MRSLDNPVVLLVMATALASVTGSVSSQDGPVQRARETARIGEGERTEFSFGSITGLAIDTAGRLYVADAQDHRIAVFDATGRHVASFGRKGQGPGEFQQPRSLAIGKDGSLWVREMDRVQRFVPKRPGAPATEYADMVAALGMVDWMSTRTGVVDRGGLFHVPVAYGSRATGATVQYMQRLDTAGRLVDSLLVPTFANPAPRTARYAMSATGGRMLRGLSHVPFAALPRWASSPAGTIISGDGLTYELRETDTAGRVLRTYSRASTPVLIDAAERRDSVEALEARIDSIPVPLAQVEGMPEDVRQRKLPAHYPVHRELVVSTGGDLWVRRWTTRAERGTSRFDVFSPDGRFRGTVVLPADLLAAPEPVVHGKWVAGIAVDAETGLQSLVRFEVAAPIAGESSAIRTP